MRVSIADSVHAVFHKGLELRERLEAGERLHANVEHKALRRLLSAFDTPDPIALEAEHEFNFCDPSGMEERTHLTEATIRFALTCWLDEWLAHYAPLGSRWSEQSLEAALFGSEVGKSKFWDEARYAETRGDLDALEVMFLCVMLGFRGDWRDKPNQLEKWLAQVRAKLADADSAWTTPSSLEPSRQESAFAGDLSYRRMTFSLLLTFALMVPFVLAAWWRM